MANPREENTTNSEAITIVWNYGSLALSHPLVHSKTLIQLGFEPLKPQLGHTLVSRFGIGKKAFFYPNIFVYCKHIKNEIGWFKLFTVGLPARIMSELINRVASKQLAQIFQIPELKENASVEVFFSVIGKQTLCTVIAGVASYPLHVIMVRQISQFIGKETYYNTIWSSIQEIWNNEGLPGFFSGVVPRVISSVLTVCITTTLAHLVNKYILANYVDPEIKKHSSMATQVFADSFAYRYVLVSVCMAVSGSRLQANKGYLTFADCMVALKSEGVLSRGSQTFFRKAPIGYHL